MTLAIHPPLVETLDKSVVQCNAIGLILHSDVFPSAIIAAYKPKSVSRIEAIRIDVAVEVTPEHVHSMQLRGFRK